MGHHKWDLLAMLMAACGFGLLLSDVFGDDQ